MRDLGAFLRAVARKLSTGVGVTLNIITALGLVGSVTVWSTPIWIWITVVILNIFGATFLAWRYEKTRADALVAELHEIKDSRPTFAVNVGDVKRYTIQSLIDDSESERASLKRAMEDAKKPVRISSSISSQAGAFSSIFTGIKRMQEGMPGMLHTLEVESNEEKLGRLNRYHKELLQYESRLKNLYHIELSVESTRHDKNIEVEITSKDTLEMIAEDNYESYDIPTTAPPSRDFVAAHSDYLPRLVSVSDKYYIQTDASNNRAVSELAYLHAAKPIDVFGSTFYVRSNTDKIELNIKIHSAKLSHPQELSVQLDLTKTPVLQIQHSEDM